MTVAASYSSLLERCEPYLVASPHGAAADPRPLPADFGAAELNRLDPHRTAHEAFLTLLQRLDKRAYGPADMVLPRWAFYDCAEVPGGVFGFAERRGNGLAPLSMLVAIPMLPEGAWHVYGLCAVTEGEGLRMLTLAAGLAVLGVRTAYGAAQWRSTELPVHARYAPLELLTAWTPAHSHPATATWRFEVTAARIAAALEPAPAPAGDGARWVSCDDASALRSVQAEIEAGRRVAILGPPRGDAVPLGEMTP